ncbi:MAG: ABC-F family ATP-binding cassette domain-containing protein [Schleiferiaceae bacterium]|nr:ABC-F family ATP-binding cassette domain-containing protein [Schleiferiaceae bacterium]
MNIMSVEQVSKSYGARVLFENLSFGISQGQKVSLIARNGTGKTTLLRILAGEETADNGIVTYRKGIRTSFLSQDPALPEESALIDYLLDSDLPEMRAIKQYEKAMLHPEDSTAFDAALAEMENLQAWDAESRIKQILSTFKLNDFEQPIKSLSGGQRRRLALARVLIESPDFIILDEPTNHLDFDMVEWLENHLSQSNITLLLVTHDRYFLEAVCNQIIELEGGQLFTYDGGYAYFLEKKQERIAHFHSNVEKAQNLYRKELEWMRRQPKARGTKSKARVDAFYDVKDAAHKKLGKEKVQLEMKMERLGSKILEAHKLKKSYGELAILNSFSYVFKNGDRIGIVGKNGVGKSTFLKMLTGEVAPDGGKVVVGDTIVFGYYTQDGIQLQEDKRVIEVVKDIAEFIPLAKGQKLTASQLLERFLFEGDAQYTYVSRLSGGEKRRLYLLTLLMKNPNFLILDEPTNDLDLITLKVLEDFLLEFPGILIIVSHDRFFLDKLTEHLFVFEGAGEIRDFPGNYTDYRAFQKEQVQLQRQQASAAAAAPKKVVEKPKEERKKLSFNEQREFEELEATIPKLESRKKEILALFQQPTEHDDMQQLSLEMEQLVAELDEKELRWLELSERV